MSDHHIVCSHCGSVNRIPPAKSALAAKCGKCGDPLFEATPVDVPANVFQRQISRSSVPVLVDVWAPWCGPCRMMAPAYEQAAARFADQVRFFKLNSDENQSAAGGLGIRGIPTLIAWDKGRMVAHQAGAQTGEGLMRWIRSTLGLNA